MPEIVLVCEGSAIGVEVRVIQALLTGARVNLDVVVRGCGGGAALGAVAQYIRAAESISTVAYVRDRDYRPLARAEESLTDGSPEFIWRRHEFENYLLEPAVVVAAMDELREFAPSLPSDEAEVRERLRSCAEQHAPVEGGRMTLSKIRADADQDAPARIEFPRFRTPDGALFSDEQCVQAVRGECERATKQAATRARHPSLDPDVAEAHYRSTLVRLTERGYLHDDLYLRDFGGRELLSCFWNSLADRRPSRLTMELFQEELASALVSLYENTDDLFRPDDFHDLAKSLRRLAGVTPA